MSVSVNQISQTDNSATIKYVTSPAANYVMVFYPESSTPYEARLTGKTEGTITVPNLQSGTTTALTFMFYNGTTHIGNINYTCHTNRYAYANSMPNFTLGNDLVIGLYNPDGEVYTASLMYGSTVIVSAMGNGTTCRFKASNTADTLYSLMTNAKTARYKIRVTSINGHVDTRDGGYFSANPNVCSPQIGTITYADSNATAVAITGNDQNIVQGVSTPTYTVTGIVPRKNATISSVWVMVNGQRVNLTYSNGTATGGNAVINSSQNVTATVYVQDSRGIQSAKDVTVTMQEHKVSATFDLKREENFYSASLLTVYATWNEFGTNALTIQATAYRVDDPTITVDIGSLQNEVTKSFTIDNNYDWTVQIKVKDSLSSWVTYTGFLGKGIPIIFFDTQKLSVGINCFPKYSRSLEVDGIIIDKSAVTLKGDQYASGSRDMKVPFNTNKTFGNRLSVYNGGIKIGNGITRVLISFHAFMEAYDTNEFRVVKNSFSQANTLIDQESSFAGEDASSHNYYEVNAMPQLVEVQEGDVLYLYVTDYHTIPEVRITNSYLTVQVG